MMLNGGEAEMVLPIEVKQVYNLYMSTKERLYLQRNGCRCIVVSTTFLHRR